MSFSRPLSAAKARRLPAILAASLVIGALLAASQLVAPAASKHAPPPANPKVSMEIEKRGTLVIELYPKAAPKTVAHFLSLVNRHFYDGILFHRYVKGFVVQGGDPASKTIKGEAIANISAEEVGAKYHLGNGGSDARGGSDGTTVPLEATLPHSRGTLGLARTNDPDTGDSQFFINLNDNHNLDNQYCVFGKVVKGMDLIDSIRQGDRIKSIRVLSATPKKK